MHAHAQVRSLKQRQRKTKKNARTYETARKQIPHNSVCVHNKQAPYAYMITRYVRTQASTSEHAQK